MQTTILLMDDRNVLVGDLELHPHDPSAAELRNASTVRYWGTDKGLGQLAKEGPRSATKLDRYPLPLKINRCYVLYEIPCVESAWAKYHQGADA